MKKRLIAFAMMIVLVLCMSMTAFAADGVSADEKAVYDHFVTVIEKYSAYLGASTIAEQKAEATRVLNALEFNADACKDLDAMVTALDSYLASKNIKSKRDLANAKDGALSIVNGTASKYFSMKVSVNDIGEAWVDYTVPSSGGSGSDTPAQQNATATVAIGQGIINQTGVDTTATVAVLGGIAMISLLGVGAFVATKSKRVAK